MVGRTKMTWLVRQLRVFAFIARVCNTGIKMKDKSKSRIAQTGSENLRGDREKFLNLKSRYCLITRYSNICWSYHGRFSRRAEYIGRRCINLKWWIKSDCGLKRIVPVPTSWTQVMTKLDGVLFVLWNREYKSWLSQWLNSLYQWI